MAHITHDQLDQSQPIPDEVDVLIVGAGMSGLYVAWRLLRDDPDRRICLLDKSNRTGGRLDSDVIHFDGVDVKEEEGGMRFTFDLMDDLMALLMILELDDQVVPFPMNSGGNNRLHFRGRAFTNAEAAASGFKIWSELYELDPPERGVDPRQIINNVFNRILAANPDFQRSLEDGPEAKPVVEKSPEFWQCFRLQCTWDNVRLIDWTLWGLLDAMGYSNEAITLMYRLLGFNGTFLSQMNAGEAFQLLEDFPADVQFKTLENGFASLPNQLVDQIGEDRIFLRTNVERLDPVDGGWAASYTSLRADPSEVGTIIAKQVVLGLPRLALERLYIGSDAINRLDVEQGRKLWDNLQTTTDQSLLKINLYYNKAWWGNALTGEPPVAFGPNFSDLPLGTVYPFYGLKKELSAAIEYKEWLAQNKETASAPVQARLDEIMTAMHDRPACLTIYCDFLNINFWRALQESGDCFESDMQQAFNDADPQVVFPASQAVVEAATRLFRKLFNTHYVPDPVLTSARIWSGASTFNAPAAEQFGFGVHQWGLHANDGEVIDYLVSPIDGLFTCGEAFSDYQGWVEGALRSADLVLDKGFGLSSIAAEYSDAHGRTANDVIAERYAGRAAEMIRTYIDPDFDDHLDQRREAHGSHHYSVNLQVEQ